MSHLGKPYQTAFRPASNGPSRVCTPALAQAALTGLMALLASLSIVACKPRAAPRPKPYVAFVANRQGNSVAAVDLSSLQMLASIAVAPSPTQVAARPGANEIYAVSSSGSVGVIAFPALHVSKTLTVGRSAAGLVFSKDGGRARARYGHPLH